MELIFKKLDHYFQKKWHLAVLDTRKGRWIVKPKQSNLSYLKAENANGRHILIKPEVESDYILVDDLSWSLIQRHHQDRNGQWRPGRLVVETSPRNYQVWIHSANCLSLTEKRYWLKRLLNDPGADPNNRYGRCPGFRNRKQKYQNINGHYPLSKLIWIDWNRQADIPKLDYDNPPRRLTPVSHQPGREVCHRKHISRSDYEKGDDSCTDFAFALALARRGYSLLQIKQYILTQRSQWTNHTGTHKKDDYLKRTINKAIYITKMT